MAGRAILTLLPVIGVLGHLDTVPLVAWSSKRLRYLSFSTIIWSKLTHFGLSSPELNSLSPDLRYEHSVSMVGGILSQDDICSFDAVVVVDQPGVCAQRSIWP
jgi:hypothetical protein